MEEFETYCESKNLGYIVNKHYYYEKMLDEKFSDYIFVVICEYEYNWNDSLVVRENKKMKNKHKS